MCGIAGTFNWGNTETLEKMTDALAHRGPDDRGVWEACTHAGGRVGLGSRRLSILDLSPAGHMPMSTEDGRLTIVYNGECYNHLQLREALQKRGHKFRSRSDTETVLKGYLEYGPEMVRQMNGIFALAIWDRAKEELFLARDHFGVKPLYYTQNGAALAFASEVKAMLQLPGFHPQLDLAALHKYLTFLWVPEPDTIFAGVKKLPPGHYAIFREGRLTLQQYWDLPCPPASHGFATGEADLVHDLRQAFVKSVKRQMLSDVPLGSFLSSGLDSSSIVAAMAFESGATVQTFTIAFAEKYRKGEENLDDPAVARDTARRFGCTHQEIVVDPDVVSMLPRLVFQMDEPVGDPAIIAAHLVSHEARKSVTVLLSGVGGDEMFAGYRRHYAPYLAEKYKRLPSGVRGMLEGIAAGLPAFRDSRLKSRVRQAKKMARSASLDAQQSFVANNVYLDVEQIAQLCSPATLEGFGEDDPCAGHFRLLEKVKDADLLNQMLYTDSKTFMPSLNLLYTDKMSMAASVEVRVPFLDWELAEWVAKSVPPALKLHDGTGKYLLRQAMRPMLPAAVLKQKKAGLGAPADHWLAGELRPMVEDLLGEERVRRRGLFQPQAVRRLIDEQRLGKEDWSLQLWQLLTLELWMQAFLD